MSNTVASSSPDLGEATSRFDEQHCHLVSVGGADVSDTVRGGVVGWVSQLQWLLRGWLTKGQLGTCSQLPTVRGT